MKPHYFGALSKCVDIKHLEEIEVSLEIPLEDRDDGLVKLREVIDLARLIVAIAVNYCIGLGACKSVETYLK